MKTIFDIFMYIPLYIINFVNRIINNSINLYFKLIKKDSNDGPNIISEYQHLYTLDSDGNVDLDKILIEPDDVVETEYDIELKNEILNAYTNHIAEINMEKERILLEKQKEDDRIRLENKKWDLKYNKYTPVSLKKYKHDVKAVLTVKRRVYNFFIKNESFHVFKGLGLSIYEAKRDDIINHHDVGYNTKLFPKIMMSSTFSVRNTRHNKQPYVKYKNSLGNFVETKLLVYLTLNDLILDGILDEISEKMIEIQNETDEKINKTNKQELDIRNYNFVINVNKNEKTKKHITSIKWEQKLMVGEHSEILYKEKIFNIRN